MYTQPWAVGRQVMSPAQTWLGAWGEKPRSTGFGATGCAWVLSVVAL
jgi:hypothetical protein